MARESTNARTALAAAVVAVGSVLGAAPGAPAEQAKREMVISGRVVGADGKPVSDGQVAVLVYCYRRSERPEGVLENIWPGLTEAPRLLGSCRTDAEGRFRLTGPGYSPALPYAGASLVAGAPGHGLVWRSIDHAAARQELTVRLNPERAVRGRLIDLQGQPADGVQVRLLWADTLFGRASDLVPFWPKPVTTDDKGRFFFRGLGLDAAAVEVTDERFAPQWLEVTTVPLGDTKETTQALAPARKFRGRVTLADTGEPAAGARLIVDTGTFPHVTGTTDDQGRFALNVPAGDSLRVIVHPPPDSPYLRARQEVPWAEAARMDVHLSLARGVLVRGRVTESPSGEPVAGARVGFRPRLSNNPFNRERTTVINVSLEEQMETAISGDDGRFQLAVLPGPGHLLALGPTWDYLHVETSFGELEYGKPWGVRYYPDALVPLDLKPGTGPHEVALRLRRGVTRTGRVVSPDGKPVERFAVVCRSYVPTGLQHWGRPSPPLEGRDGRFELPGCDPDRPVTAWFFDAEHDWGATAELSAGEPPAVRLEPCGSAVARFVGPDGKPLVNYAPPPLWFVITPGIQGSMPVPGEGDEHRTRLEADELTWGELSPRAWNLRTDDRGEITFRALVPGATYRIVLPNRTEGRDPETDGWPTKDFTVKAGETLRLPDLVIQNPAP